MCYYIDDNASDYNDYEYSNRCSSCEYYIRKCDECDTCEAPLEYCECCIQCYLHELFKIHPIGVFGDLTNRKNCTINCIKRSSSILNLNTKKNYELIT